MVEQRGHLGGAELARMAPPGKYIKRRADPVKAALCGAKAEMPAPNSLERAVD
jgi:hypothetical protein